MVWYGIGKLKFIDEPMNVSLYIHVLGLNLKA